MNVPDVATTRSETRVLACCGGMVVVFGAERITFEILRVLKDDGAEVHVIVNDWESHRIEELAASIGASTSTGHYRYSVRRREVTTPSVLRLGWNVLRTSLGLLRDARRFRPTHVFIPDYVTVLRNAPALVVLRAFGIPVLFRAATPPDRGRFYEALWRWCLPLLSTRIIVQSEFSAARCRESGVPDRKLVLVRNAIPRRTLEPHRDAEVLDLVEQRRTLLAVGQVAPFKGTHLALEATLEILDRGEDVQLVIAGRLPEWPPDYVAYVDRMKDRVESTGHMDRVHFVGSVENVHALMEASFVLLAPYLGEESFGIVVLEAMNAGLPVVTFPRGAIPELVRHGETGYLCDVSSDDAASRDALIRGLEFFLSDPRRRDEAGAACLEHFRDPTNDTTREAFVHAWRHLFSKSRSAG